MIKNRTKVYVVFREGFVLPARVYLNERSAQAWIRRTDRKLGQYQAYMVERDLVAGGGTVTRPRRRAK